MIRFKEQNKSLSGNISVYGDQELSYYSLILGTLASENSKVSGLLKSKDVLNLISILEQFGAIITEDNGVFTVKGLNKSLKEPINIIDIQDSKEILYLLIGLLSSYDFKIFFKGDNSLTKLTLEDIFSVYTNLGIKFIGRNDKNLPFLMFGNEIKKKIKHTDNDYFSGLKNSLLISSIISNNENIIIEKEKNKNHLEIMMKYFGIIFDEHDIGTKSDLNTKIGKEINIVGGQKFSGKEVSIPTNTTFAGFLATLVVLIPDSNITLKNVLINQYRDAFFRTLIDLGADITFTNQKIICGEKVADITVRYRPLKDAVIPINRIYKMLSEYYLLILIAVISGKQMSIQGANFLKEKDEENYKYVIELLKKLGVPFLEKGDVLSINGGIKEVDAKIYTQDIKNDNLLLATAFFGFFTKNPVSINDSINDIYPNLGEFLQGIGLNVEI
jgi:3-phosphoshikimate 1-carboxyvinyltransferase